ncbi:MAG TPA: Ig-like domain-containing protein [Acidimicrobiales bacterium]|nr:Ig-like domain-containing protein [Acidimicrobiales bacterium]HLN43403.1 Ig-like domain-containing protein [Acidimicrobiales bacterium]
MLVAGLLGVGGAESASALGSPVLLSITVSPSLSSVAEGATQQFTATGLYSDLSTKNLTDSVTWSSAQGLLATVSNAVGSQGLAKGLLPGVDTVTATDPSSLLSGTGALTVLPAVLTAITVSPSVASVAEGATQQFTATGLYSDGSTQNLTDSVTWSSAQGLLATVSNAVGSQGLATGLLPGVDTVTATDPSTLLSGLGALTVLSTLLPPPSPTSPVLTMTPGSGSARTGVVAHGADFVPGQLVTVTYMSGLRARKRASAVLCSTTVDAQGTFSCGGTIPRRHRSGKRGQHPVVATEPSNTKGTTIFTLFK